MNQNKISNRLMYRKFVDLRTNSKAKRKGQQVENSVPSDKDLALQFEKKENYQLRRKILELMSQNDKLKVLAYQNLIHSYQTNQYQQQQINIKYPKNKKSRTLISYKKKPGREENKFIQKRTNNTYHQLKNKYSFQSTQKKLFNQTTTLTKNNTFTPIKSKQFSNSNRLFNQKFQYINSFNKEDKQKQAFQLNNLMVPQFTPPQIKNLNINNNQMIQNQKKQIHYLKQKIKNQFQKIMNLESRIKDLQNNSCIISQLYGLSFPKVKKKQMLKNLPRSERYLQVQNSQSKQNNDKNQREKVNYLLQMMFLKASAIQNLQN